MKWIPIMIRFGLLISLVPVQAQEDPTSHPKEIIEGQEAEPDELLSWKDSLIKISQLSQDSLATGTGRLSGINEAFTSVTQADSLWEMERLSAFSDTTKLHEDAWKKGDERLQARMEQTGAIREATPYSEELKNGQQYLPDLPSDLLTEISEKDALSNGQWQEQLQLPKLENEPVKEISEVAASQQEKAGGYTDQVKELTESERLEETVTQTAEDHAGNLKEIARLQAEETELMQPELPSSLSYGQKPPTQEELMQLAQKRVGQAFAMEQTGLQGAQKGLDKLKKKYLAVNSTQELDDAVKRHSLKGEPLRKRLVWTGYFRVPSLDPLYVDASPQLGYRINKKWTAGLGLSWQKTWTRSDSTTNFREGQGHQAFVSYELPKAFFCYGELGQNWSLDGETGSEEIPQMLLGLGRSTKIHGPLRANFMILYDFTYQQQPFPNNQRWKVRFGFRFY